MSEKYCLALSCMSSRLISLTVSTAVPLSTSTVVPSACCCGSVDLLLVDDDSNLDAAPPLPPCRGGSAGRPFAAPFAGFAMASEPRYPRPEPWSLPLGVLCECGRPIQLTRFQEYPACHQPPICPYEKKYIKITIPGSTG